MYTLAKTIKDDLIEAQFDGFVKRVNAKIKQQSEQAHGDYRQWSSALDNAPVAINPRVDVTKNAVTISIDNDIDNDIKNTLHEQLKKLMPWRKGPYNIVGILVDCEWRSDFKWDRIKAHINLKNKKVLDIGCGNGYHCWRMLEQGPKWVLGIEPNVLFNLQFRFINGYAQRTDIAVIPLGIEHLPPDMGLFDSVFSMGVLYHRKSPIDHLYALKSLLHKKGELILETLVIDGDEQTVLVPQGRYAKMPNVWFIPSILALTTWLKKVGFKHIKVLDVSVTTSDEQRPTDWMLFQSLTNYLDKNDPSLTLEGHPAPKRVVISAKLR